jgi:hypothetical protein
MNEECGEKRFRIYALQVILLGEISWCTNWRTHDQGKSQPLCLPPAFPLVSCSAYFSTLKMEAICSSKTSVNSQWTTQCYIPHNGTLQKPTILQQHQKSRTFTVLKGSFIVLKQGKASACVSCLVNHLHWTQMLWKIRIQPKVTFCSDTCLGIFTMQTKWAYIIIWFQTECLLLMITCARLRKGAAATMLLCTNMDSSRVATYDPDVGLSSPPLFALTRLCLVLRALNQPLSRHTCMYHFFRTTKHPLLAHSETELTHPCLVTKVLYKLYF